VSDADGARPTNRLANETSAYLRQHMHNPVHWYPWGSEAQERARAEDKPLLVSIGYSACHWCHVMEHESFEDPSTAALMNELFVCIKVDREERPDVDQIYMDAVTGLTGHGGWPLTVFCTPDGKPFHAGTYYPPEPRHGMPAFQQVMQAVTQAYRERRGEVDESAEQITQALAKRPDGVAQSLPGAATAAQAAIRMLQRADYTHGGFGTAPKFPTPTSLDILLAGIDVLPPAKAIEALAHVKLTCVEMARNGLWDHLAGGFHRYSVDEYWRIPHFEKMLYDEGQLVRTYAETLRRSSAPDEDLVWPIRESVEFLRSEMRAEDGGWFASLDADSEGAEGKFYVWTPEQVAAVLGERAADFCSAYGVTDRGNFENGTTHLHDLARGPRSEFAAERAELLAARAERIRPGTDRKRVVSWNALVISGLARAASVLGDASMLDDAVAAADFVLARMRDEEGRLLRVYDGGRAHVTAFLDDHATLLEAFLDLYRAGAGERHLEQASSLADAIATRFYEPEVKDFYLTPNDGEPLVHRPRSDHDGAMPHSTGLATLALLRISSLTGHEAWGGMAESVLRTHAFELERAPEAYPTLSRAALAAERGLSVAVIVGEPGAARDALASSARRVLTPEDAVVVAAPGRIPAGIDPSWLHERGPIEGRPAAYVCRGVTCSLPVTSPDALVPLLDTP
jgi:uncharacterized protein YyaL (SSP411 family)